MASWLPMALQAAGTIQRGRAARDAGNANAAALYGQGWAARDQALAEEARVRREARMMLGRQVTATGQAGGGYGGSSGALLRQSMLLAELDALTVRGHGDNRARALFAQGRAEARAGRQAMRGAGLQAGARLLLGPG